MYLLITVDIILMDKKIIPFDLNKQYCLLFKHHKFYVLLRGVNYLILIAFFSFKIKLLILINKIKNI